MNKKRYSIIFLVLGLVFLTIGMSLDNTSFSFAAIIFVLLSLVLGGRWMRPRRK